MHFRGQQGIRLKQHLPRYDTQVERMNHFGNKWDVFVQMKMKHDPIAFLSPGQGILTSSLTDLCGEPSVDLWKGKEQCG